MSKATKSKPAYVRPEVLTLSATRVVESLGPVSAGSVNCGPMLANFCL